MEIIEFLTIGIEFIQGVYGPFSFLPIPERVPEVIPLVLVVRVINAKPVRVFVPSLKFTALVSAFGHSKL